MPEFISRNPWILLIFVVLALIEYGWRTWIAKRGYDWRASLGSLGVALGQVLIKPLAAGLILAVYAAAHAHALFKLSIYDWRIWLVAFVGVELAYYWFHRTSHRVNWFWATHAVHHSANEMTLPAAIRLGWTGQITGVWLFFVPLVLVGFPPIMIVGLLGADLIYQFGLHTEAVGKLWSPIEYVFNTPSHHRAHHASDQAMLDKNFGGVLIVFDRLFASFAAEPDGGGLTYGLVAPLQSNNPFRIALNQWIILGTALTNTRGWRRRCAILLGPPHMLDRQRATGPKSSLRMVPRPSEMTGALC